ncbi:MAG: DegT/DnrJ/EryC1/StrS family aminotransferase [Caldisericota bacterium]|nr:DegT/DnrJ/EryC1/StrS family aminotransferase [Caldisericota bacterium]
MNVPLSCHWIDASDEQAVLGVLRSDRLSLGPRVPEFEAGLARVAQVTHGVAVNSGTSALHLIVRSLGLGEGDEVITTPFSFIASANCLLFERVKPVFVDVRPDTYNIDPVRIAAAMTQRTKGILAVDAFGQPAELDAIERIADQNGLQVIEDSCESLGSEWQGRRCGSWGAAGAFAFYPNKQITTGEGGCVVTQSDDIASFCRSMRNQGRGSTSEWLEHERLGYNYRISDISCALGSSQLKRLDKIIELRGQAAERYKALLRDVPEVVTQTILPDVTRMSWFVFVVRLVDRFTQADRDWLIGWLSDRGIQSRPYFTPIHLQPFYMREFGYKAGDFPITEQVAARTIALPFFTMITHDQQDYVVTCLKDGLAVCRREHR